MYIQNAQGNVSITESYFKGYGFYPCSYSAVLYISYDAKIVVAISNSQFDGVVGPLIGCSVLGSDCSGIWIEPSSDVFEFNQFLLKNITIFYYKWGLNLTTNGENAVVQLLSMNVYNNIYGIFIYMKRNTNRSSGTVDVLSGIYRDNHYAVYITADTVTIASNTFINNIVFSTNVIANTVSITCATFELSVSIISAYIVNVSSVTFVSNPLDIYTHSHGSSVYISNSYFYNNSVSIDIYGISISECTRAIIVFKNLLFSNTTSHGDTDYPVLQIHTENSILSAVLKMSALYQTI